MKSRGTALSTRIVRAGLAGLLLLPLGVTAPWAMADGGQGDSSEVSGSAEGTADGGGQVTISVESSVTTAGSGGGVTSSSLFSRIVNLPVVKV